ncbi:MAG TPA: hypothetical protein VE990_11615 [Acidimicrobiales bacterium]|nr:hypothetical protein [Acidimicrobiales bacterium]
MADYGVAITWNESKAGREKQALALWMEAVAMNDKAVANGELEKWDAVIFEMAPGSPAGALRLYGSEEQVEAFMRTDDFRQTIMRAGMLLNNVGYVRFVTGDRLVEGFAKYAELVESL